MSALQDVADTAADTGVLGSFSGLEIAATGVASLFSLVSGLRMMAWLVKYVQQSADASNETSRKTIADLQERVTGQNNEIRDLRAEVHGFHQERAEWISERSALHVEIAELRSMVVELERRLDESGGG